MPNTIFQQNEAIEWKRSEGLVAYEDALAFMEARVAGMIAGEEPPCIWFLEHPPLYTAGTSATAHDLLDKERFPIYQAGRGGEYTYHGPGQLVAYVMLDLKTMFAPHPPDLRAYIQRLEQWIIGALARFGVQGVSKPGMIGVWVENNIPAAGGVVAGSEINKIAAIGVRIRKWVSFHGIAINIAPDISHYQGIVPCGIRDYGVTSLKMLGCDVSREAVEAALKQSAEGE